MYWLTTDTHFGHETLVKEGYRPADFEDRMELGLLKAGIKPTDTLIHLGDVALYGPGRVRWSEISRLLNCQKILVRGNHDSMSTQSAKSNGFDVIVDGLILKAFGKTVMFTHVPLEDPGVWDFNIHGHLHAGEHRGVPFANDRRILISMEFLQYRPIPLETVLELGSTPTFVKGKFQSH